MDGHEIQRVYALAWTAEHAEKIDEGSHSIRNTFYFLANSEINSLHSLNYKKQKPNGAFFNYSEWRQPFGL